MALLDGLDRIPWGELHHAYGAATDVPDLLRALVAPERASQTILAAAKRAQQDVREHVIGTLYGNVFHQGTVWQASPHVVPFLVEILRDGPRDRELHEFLLDYLHHLAFGYPEDVFPDVMDPATYFQAANDAPEDPADRLDPANMAAYARDCYLGVEAALPVIASFAHDPDPPVALAAIALLASFRSDLTIAALRDVVAAQQGRTQAIALVALARFDPDAVRPAARQLLGDGDPYIAMHAAAALLLADPESIDEAAVVLLTQPLDDLTEATTPLARTVGTLVSRCLQRLPERHLERVVRAFADTLATAAPITNLSATAALLGLIFPDGHAPEQAAALTPAQRSGLEAIAAHGAFMIGGGQFANYSLLLSRRGLPDDSAALTAWLADKAG